MVILGNTKDRRYYHGGTTGNWKIFRNYYLIRAFIARVCVYPNEHREGEEIRWYFDTDVRKKINKITGKINRRDGRGTLNYNFIFFSKFVSDKLENEG